MCVCINSSSSSFFYLGRLVGFPFDVYFPVVHRRGVFYSVISISFFLSLSPTPSFKCGHAPTMRYTLSMYLLLLEMEPRSPLLCCELSRWAFPSPFLKTLMAAKKKKKCKKDGRIYSSCFLALQTKKKKTTSITRSRYNRQNKMKRRVGRMRSSAISQTTQSLSLSISLLGVFRLFFSF